MEQDHGEIILYQTEGGDSAIDVHLKDDTVWLTQGQMVELFQRDKRTVSEHIRNVFNEGELTEKAVVRNYRTTAVDGKKYQTNFYNLDVIISVGYRVKSQRGTQFRIWATSVLKSHKRWLAKVGYERVQRSKIRNTPSLQLTEPELLGMDNFIQHISDPFVNAFSACSSSRGDLGMNIRRDAQGELAGVWLVWFISQFCAGFKVMVNGVNKRGFQFIHGCTMERNNIPNTNNTTEKNSVFSVKFNPGSIALVCQCVFHGVIPIVFRKSRAAFTRYRNDSIFRHSILPFTGSVNTDCNDYRLLVFIDNMVSFFATISRAAIYIAV